MNNNQDVKISISSTNDNQDKGFPHNFDLIKTFNVNNDDNDINMDIINEDNEGFKTPTSIENKIMVNCACPPPAPRKLNVKTMKRRRISDHKSPMMKFLKVSNEDIEMLFTPRSVVVVKDKKDNVLGNLGLKRVKKANNISTILSFR